MQHRGASHTFSLNTHKSNPVWVVVVVVVVFLFRIQANVKCSFIISTSKVVCTMQTNRVITLMRCLVFLIELYTHLHVAQRMHCICMHTTGSLNCTCCRVSLLFYFDLANAKFHSHENVFMCKNVLSLNFNIKWMYRVFAYLSCMKNAFSIV